MAGIGLVAIRERVGSMNGVLQDKRSSRKLATVSAGILTGLDVQEAGVQVLLQSGKPAFHIVGLGDKTVKESSQRVTAALKNSGFNLPDGVITVNLAPALTHKRGTGFDLAIAIGILMADGTIAQDVFNNYLIVGELSLDGAVSNVCGMMAYGKFAASKSKGLVCADKSGVAGMVRLPVVEIKHLRDLHELSSIKVQSPLYKKKTKPAGDFADFKGQSQAIRALTVAAAGGHNALMVGVAGTSKTALASRVSTILPKMCKAQKEETEIIYSVADATFAGQRPFRAPHHSSTIQSILGGGKSPLLGDVSLAHHGVLYLDDVAQFSRTSLAAIKTAAAEKEVRIVRAQGTHTLPSDFLLLGSAKPCPCGYLGDEQRNCRCLPHQIEFYQNRIKGSVADCFEMFIYVPPASIGDFVEQDEQRLTSKELAESVEQAQQFAHMHRVVSVQHLSRSQLFSEEMIDENAQRLLRRAAFNLRLSGRSIVTTLRVGRTIADLAQSERIAASHISEALSYRETWGKGD